MHGNRCYVKSGENHRVPTLRVRDQKFAEPVSLSSTALADFSLPGTVLKFGFDLLGLRARRKWESRGWTGVVQGPRNTSRPQFAEIQFSTFPQQTVQLVENRNAPGDKVRPVVHLRPPSTSQGVISFLWGLFFGVFIWLGSMAVGVSGATAFIVGSVSGFLIFLAVYVYGGDEPGGQPERRAAPPR